VESKRYTCSCPIREHKDTGYIIPVSSRSSYVMTFTAASTFPVAILPAPGDISMPNKDLQEGLKREKLQRIRLMGKK